MYCSKCGVVIREGAKFCPSCGNPINNNQIENSSVEKKKVAKVNGIKKPQQMSQEEQVGVKKKIIICACIALLVGLLVFLLLNGLGLLSTTPPKTETDGFSYYDTPKEHKVIDNETGIAFVDNELQLEAKQEVDEKQVEEFADHIGGKIVGRLPAVREYQLLLDRNYSYTELQTLISTIQQSGLFEYVSPNYVTSVSSDFMPNDSKVNKTDTWGNTAIDAEGAWDYYELMDRPVNIGVIDNVFLETHQDLPLAESPLGNVHGNDYYKKKGEFDSHGTHVAGIIAASFNNKKGIAGLVPTRNLYGFSYYGFQDMLTSYNNKVSFYYLIHEKKCKVVNYSASCRLLNFNANHEQSGDSFNKAATNEIEEANKDWAKMLKSLIDAGDDFIICKAAGNQNGEEYKYFKKDSDDKQYPYTYISYDDYLSYLQDSESSKYNYEKYKNRKDEISKRLVSGNVDSDYDVISGITDEQVKSRIIVVGAVETKGEGGYAITSFSQCGKRVDILAPGSDILSTVRGPWYNRNAGYDVMSGTSMATPFVAGVAGQLFSLNPKMTGPEVKKLICETGTGSYGNAKYKLLNAKNAVEKAAKSLSSNEKTQEKKGSDISKYLEVIEKYEKDYGLATVTETSQTGLQAVKLVDLNKDGVQELILLYTKNNHEWCVADTCDVWAIQDNQPTLIGTTGVSISQQSPGYEEITLLEKDGVVMIGIVDDNSDILFDATINIYSYDGKSLKTVYSGNIKPETYNLENPDDEKYHCVLNNQTVTESQFMSYWDLITNGEKVSAGILVLSNDYLSTDKAQSILRSRIEAIKHQLGGNKTVEEKTGAELLKEMPDKYVMTSGAGAWRTYLEIASDGSFKGQFTDSEMGLSGEGFEDGTVYISTFKGRFSAPVKKSDYVYSMQLESLDVEGEDGDEYLKDHQKFIVCDPPTGFRDAKTFELYLPYCPIEKMPESIVSWYHFENLSTLPENTFAIYNSNGDEGFINTDEVSYR